LVRARIDDHVLGENFTSKAHSSLTRFHPIIPFKNHKKIAQQITWAASNDYRQGRYCLANRNCEHFANACVYGINYSEQVNNHPVGARLCPSCFPCKDDNGNPTNGGNNDKGSTIKLTDELTETNQMLGESSNYQLENRIEQAKPDYMPTDSCRIM
jgi:hypothetical protein